MNRGSYERRWYHYFGTWWELHIGHRGVRVDFTIPLPPRIRFGRTSSEDAERLDEGRFPDATNDMRGWL